MRHREILGRHAQVDRERRGDEHRAAERERPPAPRAREVEQTGRRGAREHRERGHGRHPVAREHDERDRGRELQADHEVERHQLAPARGA